MPESTGLAAIENDASKFVCVKAYCVIALDGERLVASGWDRLFVRFTPIYAAASRPMSGVESAVFC